MLDILSYSTGTLVAHLFALSHALSRGVAHCVSLFLCFPDGG